MYGSQPALDIILLLDRNGIRGYAQCVQELLVGHDRETMKRKVRAKTHSGLNYCCGAYAAVGISIVYSL
jgi:hypothetical protein